MTSSNRVSFLRVSNGLFEIYLDARKSNLEIINGSHGASGGNTYGIHNVKTDVYRWLGSLATCKRMAERWLLDADAKRQERKAAEAAAKIEEADAAASYEESRGRRIGDE